MAFDSNEKVLPGAVRIFYRIPVWRNTCIFHLCMKELEKTPAFASAQIQHTGRVVNYLIL